MRTRESIAALLAVTLLAPPGEALAALGGDAASVDLDHVRMKAQRRVLASENYSIQEMQLSSGTTVREYLSPAGKVFAVTWTGPQMPDLEQLFGAHFTTYRNAAKGMRKGHRRQTIEEAGLVVQSGGHMRGFVGRAYLPQLVPEGVPVDELR
jgi:hypothetical protein